MSRYAVSLTFSDSTAEAAAALSEAMQPYCIPNSPVLGHEKRGEPVPHLSLIHVDLEHEDQLAAVRKAFGDILGEFRARFPAGLELELCSVQPARPGNSWLFWLANRTPSLLALHEAAVRTLDPIRNGRKVEMQTGKMDPVQAEMYRTWGYPHVMKAFQPHLTLGVLTKRNADDSGLVKRISRKSRHKAADVSLSLGEVGEFGAHTKTLFSLPL